MSSYLEPEGDIITTLLNRMWQKRYCMTSKEICHLKKEIIRVLLIYSVVLASGVRESDLVTHTHTHTHTHTYAYIHSFSDSFPLEAITEQVESPVHYSKSLWLIYFTYIVVGMR